MKQSKTKALLLAAAGSVLLTLGSAKAANSFYTPGDLVLYFQQEGDSDTVYVSLGNTATVFRGAATGADVTDILDMININAQLNAAFGASWATATNLYMGVAGVWGTDPTNATLQNGDPHRTLYVGQSRDGVGAVGSASSTGYTVNTNTGMTSGATGITAMGSPFDDLSGANGYNAAAIVSPTSASTIDDQNPFLAPGLQGTAFNIFSGGVQQVGTAGLFASNFGVESQVEFALDLYRIQARDNISGQFGQGDGFRQGTYEGTITLDSDGNVSFVTGVVPEPSTYALLGLGLAGVLFAVCRRKKSTV